MNTRDNPPVCSYEDSDYQSSFWDNGGREYEDRTEAVALKRLLPKSGRLLLELGAGAGRNTPRYTGYDRIALLDYSHSQLEQAQKKLGRSERYIFVAADVYRLPFVDGLFDAATMIRVLHHMVDAPKALMQVRNVMQPDGAFVLEFANKLNLKAMLRYWLGRQTWSPFTPEPVEFAKLNFDFNPRTVKDWLEDLGFKIEKILTVSHFRMGLLKRTIPVPVLVFFDSLLQWTGAFFQWTPSVFIMARGGVQASDTEITKNELSFFKCPVCGHSPLQDNKTYLICPDCQSKWEFKDGIYDFRKPIG
jgi:ubiquinone/menaquinone biosynthesis C-methylase UbiE